MSSNKKFAYPHGNVLYRKLRYQFPYIVRGEGVYLFDNEERRYLDASGGAMVVNAGHGNAEIARAIGEQAAKLAYVSGMQFTHEPVEELARELCAIAPAGLNKAFFLSGGTEATEAAMKLVRQYWMAKGQTKKYKVISRMPSYHGNTLGSMGVSGRQHYRTLFEPLYIDHPKIPPPICYRCPWGKTFPQCDYECAQELELAIQQADPETVAAFIAEPVLGSTGGAMVPPEQYYPRVLEICRKYDVLFIADEILCGMGRTGDWFAISSYGVTPDVLLVGKGLTGGYVALSAMLTREDIITTIRESGSEFLHAQTFAQHPVACAAGLATIRFLQQHDLLARCTEMGTLLHQELLAHLTDHPLVGDIRGRGLLAGIEFVRDKTTRAPFPRAWRVVELVSATALAHGLVVWTNVGHVDGKDGDLIMLAPPFIVTDEQVHEIVTILSRVLDMVAEEISHKGGWTRA
ncbi:aspartate aminotransferase family protein [candidate division KSB1 bacterium]|nr:aspartate aminotransferase family protein [candidate division KSB1 bacterium]